jgi:hypothetical protein
VLGSVLRQAPPTDEQRQQHDTRNLWVVLAVMVMLGLYAWAFTHAWFFAGLPAPRDLAGDNFQEHVFRETDNIDVALYMSEAHEFKDNEGEMMAFYILLAEAFLCVYFLPLRFKRHALSLWTLVMVAILYGPQPLAGLLLGHSIAFLTMHPDRGKYHWTGLLPGALAGVAAGQLPWIPVYAVAGWVAYKYLYLRILAHERAQSVLALVIAHGILPFTFFGSLADGWYDVPAVPLGALLFFGSWLRLIMYHVDYREGLVPKEMPLDKYFANFLTPGVVPNWFHATVSQGYAYTESVFLNADKNKIALGGLKLMAIAFVYLSFGDWFCYKAAAYFESIWDIPTYHAQLPKMAAVYGIDHDVTTASVLITSLLALFRFTFYWAGVSHFKVGVWRLCGFNVDAHFDNWLLSTDFLILWRRYTYHYREFLVRGFFYPTFFALSKWSVPVRTSIAIFVAAGLANLIYGHGLERLFYDGLYFGNLSFHLRRWPYFGILAVAIIATQLYQMGRPHRRKPWTWGWGILWDVVCVCGVIQFYALLHIFAYPSPDTTAGEMWQMFFLGFGISP